MIFLQKCSWISYACYGVHKARPCYFVSHISQFMSNLRKEHWTTTKKWFEGTSRLCLPLALHAIILPHPSLDGAILIGPKTLIINGPFLVI